MIFIKNSTDYKILKWKRLATGEFIYLFQMPIGWSYVKHDTDDETVIDSRYCKDYVTALHEFNLNRD